MTSLDKIERGPIAAPDFAAGAGHRLSLELTETLKLAVPLALTQLGQIAMMTTDLAFIGRLGDGAVAAAALAHTIFFVSFTVGMGLVSAVSPLAAQAHGARNPHRVRRSLRVGLWAAFLISLPVMALPFWGEKILLALGQSPAAAARAADIVVSSLADDASLRAVVSGPEGILAGLRPGAVHIGTEGLAAVLAILGPVFNGKPVSAPDVARAAGNDDFAIKAMTFDLFAGSVDHLVASKTASANRTSTSWWAGSAPHFELYAHAPAAKYGSAPVPRSVSSPYCCL